MSFHAIEVIQPAIDKTKAFFSGPNWKQKWFKIGILIFIFTMLSGGGGGNFSNGGGDSGSFDEVGPQIESAISSVTPEMWNTIIIVAIVGFVLLFLLGIFFTQLRNITFFAILESIKTDNVMIIAYWRKFWGKAVSLTIFQTILGILTLPLGFLVLFIIIAGIIIFFGINTSILGPLAGLATVPILLVLGLIAFIGFVIFVIIDFILGQFAMYWMYISEMRAFEAFKKSFSLVTANLKEVVILILIKIVIGIFFAIISMIAALILLIPLAIIGIIAAIIIIPLAMASPVVILLGVLGAVIALFIFTFLLTVILAPLSVFEFNYDLLFLKKLIGTPQFNQGTQ